MVYEIIAVSCFACCEFDSVIERIEKCYEYINFLIRSVVKYFLLFSSSHVCPGYVWLHVVCSLILQKYSLLINKLLCYSEINLLYNIILRAVSAFCILNFFDSKCSPSTRFNDEKTTSAIHLFPVSFIFLYLSYPIL